jgi:uncharacterized cupin superfamily protein
MAVTSKHILRKADIEKVGDAIVSHPLDATARRRSLSLGDATGLTLLGVHLNVIAPGDMSTVHHSHELVDEFMYLVSGTATVWIGDDEFEVGPGDFVGLPARGPAHSLKNTGTSDVTYLIGGGRPSIDVCNYPKLKKRLYLVERPDGRHREFVELDAIERL